MQEIIAYKEKTKWILYGILNKTIETLDVFKKWNYRERASCRQI